MNKGAYTQSYACLNATIPIVHLCIMTITILLDSFTIWYCLVSTDHKQINQALFTIYTDPDPAITPLFICIYDPFLS